jgi:hypothetical protein
MAFDWKAAVSTVAPTLGTMLGGPLAGTAISAILGVFGLDSGASEAQIAKAVQNATPEQLLALKAEDNRHAEAMEQLGLKREEIAATDRGSARERETKTGDVWTPRVLATVVIGGFFACVGAVMFGAVEGIKDPLTAGMVGSLIGYASAKADQVVSYYFGSSASSKAKDDTVHMLAKK